MPIPPSKTWEEIQAMTDTDHMRHWCDSVDETFQPRADIPKGETPNPVPETFLAHSIKLVRDLCDKLDNERSET